MNPAAQTDLPRVDARLKVTGRAVYSAEHRIDGLVHAVLVLSRVAAGTIRAIDDSAAQRVPGVLAVLTYRNAGGLNGAVTGRPGLDKHLPLLNGVQVFQDRQPVAVVVAETFEAAEEAAARVSIDYDSTLPRAILDGAASSLVRPKQTAHGEPPEIVRGDARSARAGAAVLFEATYTTPIENHNPIEPHASIAMWDGDRLTIYDATQGVFEERRKLAAVFGLPVENVRVISPFVGGGFGNKGSVWWHQCLAAAAARFVGRPVKLVLTRAQMFATTGHRAQTRQRISIGADAAGRVSSYEHDVTSDTSTYDVFVESAGEYASMAYEFQNVVIRHRVVPLNLGTPTFMRAPGEATGTYALECAMDELAAVAGLDPIELRLRNYSAVDRGKEDKPFTSKLLRECYAAGAERFGWEARSAAPRSMRDGRLLIGYGMAGGAYPSQIFECAADVTLDDGAAIVRSGTHELGQGARTVLAQIAAEELGIDVARVRVELGDTAFPNAMNSGGSTTTASVGSAVALACREIVRQRASRSAGGEPLRAQANYGVPEKRKPYSAYSFCAHFAEVAVDPDFGTVRMRRMVSAFDVGRVVNERLTRSQCIGGMTMGIGMALLEEARVDARTARIMNANLADYLVPVNADIGAMDVLFVGGYDDLVNEIGTKPVGEIGICGAAAAVANAVFHATGRRVRELPIRSSKLL